MGWLERLGLAIGRGMVLAWIEYQAARRTARKEAPPGEDDLDLLARARDVLRRLPPADPPRGP